VDNKPIFLNYVAAGYPLLWIQTHEEFRAMTVFAKEMSEGDEEYSLFSWDRVDGIKFRQLQKGVLKVAELEDIDGMEEEEGLDDPLIALSWAETRMPANSILFLQDYHHYIDKDQITRKIRNLISIFKATGKVLVILSHCLNLPDEIEKEVTPIQFKLPDIDELRITLKGICEAALKMAKNKIKIDALYPKNDIPILEAALGMTAFEAENAFALSLREKGCFHREVINREKAAIVKKTGMLEVIEVKNTLADVGGLELLKDWLLAREDNTSEKARKFGIRPPKGLLLGGLPGTGKSLSAKCTADVMKRPLLRFDMGSVFGQYVGESERNIRRVLDIADAVAPCVLWIDELEKAFTGTTWLEEKTSDVFIVATANKVSAIDEPLLRRLKVVFWVDLPDAKQREAIIAIQLRKIDRDPKNYNLPKLAKASDKFSGAEIETWVIDEALPFAFSKGHEDLTDEALIESAKEMVPQAIMMAEDIQRDRKWAEDHNVRPASKMTKKVEVPVKDGKRKLSIGGSVPGGMAS
jgi:SpoVK/Ycf46/Vps4 family AAA+-type ATPase